MTSQEVICLQASVDPVFALSKNECGTNSMSDRWNALNKGKHTAAVHL